MTASHYYNHDYIFIYMCIYIANYQKPFSNYYRVIIIRTGTWMALKLLVLLHEEKNYQIYIYYKYAGQPIIYRIDCM